jgi:23S rRNA pseudouridine1911/1915/1917 synthase
VPKRTFPADPSQEGERLDVFLSQRIKRLTRSQIQKKIEESLVKVNGIPRKSSYRLQEGDLVEFDFEYPEKESLQPEDIPVKTLYHDEHVIVLEKPSGMTVHPGSGCRNKTLVNALLHHFPGIADIGPEMRPGIVHRLDKETSGLMVAARSLKAYDELRRQFKQRLVEKFYVGLVWGNVSKQSGVIDWAVGRHVKHGERMSVKTKKPRAAETRFQVLGKNQKYTFLEIKPITGRTHQIRVHFAASGHPIVGDPRYGKKKPDRRCPRLFLHAARLVFFHPESKERMDFVSPLPDDLEMFLAMETSLKAPLYLQKESKRDF